MPSTPLRARSVVRLAACVTLLVVAACTGRNDGNRDSYGGSSDGEGGTPPAGPRAGQSSDTTTGPNSASPAAASPANAAPQKPDSAKGGPNPTGPTS